MRDDLSSHQCLRKLSTDQTRSFFFGFKSDFHEKKKKKHQGISLILHLLYHDGNSSLHGTRLMLPLPLLRSPPGCDPLYFNGSIQAEELPHADQRMNI